MARRLTSMFHRGKPEEPIRMQAASAPAAVRRERPRQTQTDVPFDLISNIYSPAQTSLKGPFRADGGDHHRDQELAYGYAEERWNAEDRYTNKSGDPRIGTHGRSYEPGEHRTGRNR
jgi:hypothetical protein